MKTIRQKNLRWLWLSVFILIVDQATKWWALHLTGPQALLPHLNAVLTSNRGSAFGFLNTANFDWQIWMFGGIAFIVALAILVSLIRAKTYQPVYTMALALILAGALGNLTDRLLYGHVIDFIDFYVGHWHWYTFNIADSAICTGAGLIVLIQLFSSEKK